MGNRGWTRTSLSAPRWMLVTVWSVSTCRCPASQVRIQQPQRQQGQWDVPTAHLFLLSLSLWGRQGVTHACTPPTILSV